uniref:Integrase core domain containing protein n=1 Tax=Solanum tuberosum TaxID=4113 RepID=M1DT32_SOLTU
MLAVEKRIIDEMWKELAILKDMMDGLEVHVQDQMQVVGSVSTDEVKTHYAEMQAQVAKLAEKPGELTKSKSDLRKHKAGESDVELHADLSKEEIRQHKKTRKASRKKAREKDALVQQQRDTVLAGAFGSGVLVPVSGS